MLFKMLFLLFLFLNRLITYFTREEGMTFNLGPFANDVKPRGACVWRQAALGTGQHVVRKLMTFPVCHCNGVTFVTATAGVLTSWTLCH